MIYPIVKSKASVFTLILVSLTQPLAHAGEADILKVTANKLNAESYQFEVTVHHKDEGWEHYANKWEVLGPDGTIYGTRTLYHPHVYEQPFTRSLSGVIIPAAVDVVSIRAHDSVHDYGGKTINVELPE